MNYKLGIIGYGGMGRHHHRMLKNVQGVSAVSAFDIDPDANAAARDAGLAAYSSLEDILASDLDIALISTPNDIHHPYAIAALEAGKHVIVEKPAAMNSRELLEMSETAKRVGRVFSVHQNRRWDEDFLIVKELYESKALGGVFSIGSRVMGSRGIPGDWRGRKAQGGGMVLDWGVHLLDQALMMVPERVVDVYVRMYHITNAEVDDGFQVFLTFEGGLVYEIEVATSAFISLPRWHVSGADGTAVINDWDCSGKIIKLTDPSQNDAAPIQAGAGLTKTMAPRTEMTAAEFPLPRISADEAAEYYGNFAAAIEGREPLIVLAEQALRVMRVMEAMFESERSNASVRVSI